MPIDTRVKQLVRDNKGTRLHVLFVMWAMNKQTCTAADISEILNSDRNTITDSLRRMEADGYVAHVGPGRWPRWTLTDIARQLSLPGMIPAEYDAGKTRIISSSSSDLILSSTSRSDQTTEEEEKSTLEERTAIADEYRLTGDYRAAVLADDWITRQRFEGWIAAAEGKRSPNAYAVRCCLNHDEPPEPESIASGWERDIERRDQSMAHRARMQEEANAAN